MKLLMRGFLVIGAFCALSVVFSPTLLLYADLCFHYPVDKSQTIQRGDSENCGDTVWDLVAQYGGGIYDEGYYDGRLSRL